MTELILQQEKLKLIDSLTNCIQKVTAQEAKEIAYFIHQIIEATDISLDMYRKCTSFSLLANKDLFITLNQ